LVTLQYLFQNKEAVGDSDVLPDAVLNDLVNFDAEAVKVINSLSITEFYL